ncbi:unnamed protein product [Lymnaea stagnalis]|uniref:RNA polymerase II-associated protein 3 n=1 Tax=Lymnaea stagnalis TaxID=6523 RepID=A0AAV2I6D0_LYMST
MPISEHEKKMLDLQTQVRQNQSELQDYLSELNHWENDIKKKEEQLKAVKSDKIQELPPVRNTIHKKKLKKKKKDKPADQNKPKKISGSDFRAWDKFDVDKALEEIDKNDKKEGTSSSDYETDEEWELERKKHLAGLEKDKGNEFLKNGDLDKAIEAYSKGMQYDPTNAILPANRAMALLKQQKFGAAELDSTISISLDPLYVKAYLRRATARSGMGKLTDAIADFKRVLDLEPTNKHAKTELERLEKEIDREKKTPLNTTLTEGQMGIVKPIYKPPEERSKVPLRLVPIEEIGLEPRHKISKMEQSETAKKIKDTEGEKFDKLLKTSQDTRTHDSSDKHEASQKAETEQHPHSSNATSGKSNHVAHTSDATQEDISLTDTVVNTVGKGDEFISSEQDVSAKWPGGDSHVGSGDSFNVPTTSFQFQKDFKLLKNKPESFVQYFQAISPVTYPQLFGQCLDAEILNTILKSLLNFSNHLNVSIYDVLLNLSQVKRFCMTAMFLSQKDKQVVRDLIKQLEESKKHPESHLTALRKKFDV